jgi:hypothetical protein
VRRRVIHRSHLFLCQRPARPRLTSAFTLSESPYGPWPQPPSMVECSCTRDALDPRPKDPRCCWWYGGAPGLAFRLCGETLFWWGRVGRLPSVVDYDGQENQMPIDSHALLLLIAPRHFARCAVGFPERGPSACRMLCGACSHAPHLCLAPHAALSHTPGSTLDTPNSLP